MSEAQKPSVGRIVHYNQPENEKPINGHRMHPAIITAVWSDDTVNLKVFFDCGEVTDKTSQQLSSGHWAWPPRV